MGVPPRLIDRHSEPLLYATTRRGEDKGRKKRDGRMWNARKKERVTKTNEEGKRENKETEKKR